MFNEQHSTKPCPSTVSYQVLLCSIIYMHMIRRPYLFQILVEASLRLGIEVNGTWHSFTHQPTLHFICQYILAAFTDSTTVMVRLKDSIAEITL